MLERILWFLWNIYLSETFFYFLINDKVRLSAQSEQAPTQKFLFLNKCPGRLISHLH